MRGREFGGGRADGWPQEGQPPWAGVADGWAGSAFRVEERRFTIGRQYRVVSAQGTLLAYAKARWFRFKEAFTFYTGEDQRQVAFEVKATKVFDFNANLEVRDAKGVLHGTLRRKGWASIVADQWQILDVAGKVVGELHENAARGVARRMLTRLIPYRADVNPAASGQGRLAEIKGVFQIWGDTYDVHVLAPGLDGRVLCALVVVVDSLAAERGSILDVTGLGS